jgi:REP element-mobilizing transposase RayT
VARKHRQEEAGRFWHVVARGIARRKLFADDADCQVYLVMLRGVLAVYGWRIYAYCLMGNHIHLIVQTPLPNLATGMQRLHGHYATYYNRRTTCQGTSSRRATGRRRSKQRRIWKPRSPTWVTTRSTQVCVLSRRTGCGRAFPGGPIATSNWRR